MRTKLKTAIPVCVLLCSTAYAQSRKDSSALKGDHMTSEVVITGQYSASSTDKAVQRIRVVDRKKIDAMSAQTLRDVLSNDLNIRIAQDNILGSSMSIQGISGENVKILIDGVPVIGRQNGNIDLSQINLNNIERIEIIEGPMAVSYGSDALAGTINLITKKNQRNLLEVGATAYYETPGTLNVNARAGVHKGKHTVSINGGRNYFDGWTQGEPILETKAHLADSTRVQPWKPREQYFGDVLYSYKTEKVTLGYQGHFFTEQIINRGLPVAPYGQYAFDGYYRTNRIDNMITAATEVRKGQNINFLLAYNDYIRTANNYYDDLTTLTRKLSTNDGDQDTSKFHSIVSRATYSTSMADRKINYEAGYDLHYDDATGHRIKNGIAYMGDYAAFASAEYMPTQYMTIRPGLRYGYNTDYNAPLMPSLHVRYKLTDDVTLRASYGKGFRAPSLKELYFNFVDINHNIQGNKDLKAEYSDNYSLSAVYNKRIGNVGLKTEGLVFYNNIKDKIDLLPNPANMTEYSYYNIYTYKTQGVQVSAEAVMNNIKIGAGVACTGTYNAASDTANVPKFSYSPEVNANINYDIKKYGVTVSAFYKYTGRSFAYTLDAGKLSNTYVGAYNTADVSVAKSFFDKRLNVGVGCKNLFNVTNVISYGSTTVHAAASGTSPINCGRYYFAKMTVNLKKTAHDPNNK